MNNRDEKLGRREFGIAGLSAAALAAWSGTAIAQVDDRPARPASKPPAVGDAHETSMHDAHQMLEKCAKACSDCQRACDSCATHCAMMLHDGKREHMASLRTCLDCADVCAAAAQIVARSGVFASLICEACADACKRCGDECAKFPNDQHMKMCADVCRACEKECREMLQHAEHLEHSGVKTK